RKDSEGKVGHHASLAECVVRFVLTAAPPLVIACGSGTSATPAPQDAYAAPDGMGTPPDSASVQDSAAMPAMDQATPPADGAGAPVDESPVDEGPAPGGDATMIPTEGGGPGDAPRDVGSTVSWSTLRNPFYAHDGWSVKDVAVVYGPDGVIHAYFSAFFLDAGMERCHVAQTSTRDLQTFTPAMVIFDGQSDGWVGMCSPDVQHMGGQYVMTFNAWGDSSPKPKQLFYATSSDLTTWSVAHPLAATLTAGRSYIDAALAPSAGRLFLFYKDDQTLQTHLAAGAALDGPWHSVGSGLPTFMTATGQPTGQVHENYQLLMIDGHWRLLSTDYSPITNEGFLYAMHGAGQAETDWLTWEGGYKLAVQSEAFNTNHVDNAAYLVDERASDGFFYLFYAGRTEGSTHAGRGDNKLGVSRSTDLMVWKPAGQ
ncbi:MAG TPA: hypothetical protein VGY54_01185, partial [Polyangiaceae bacterium]|nr:hypothetical protein [Polyangiaceae bacterium]